MSEEITPQESTPETAIVPSANPVVLKEGGNVAVTALMPGDMANCHQALLEWCERKIAELTSDANELRGAMKHALEKKWKSATFKRHAELAEKRIEFYDKIKAALAHGYIPVPNFPVTAFAIRTKKQRPLRLFTTNYGRTHTQAPETLPAGEGEYQNPFPVVHQATLAPAAATTNERCSYWAESWKDFEFPFSMAKPEIMEATSRAMELKIFDDIGILPQFAPSEGTRRPKGDPMIIARIQDPRHPGYGPNRFVTFMIAWHLDTRTL